MKIHCPALSDNEISVIRQAAVVRTIRKKQLLLQAGEICRYKMFVMSGFLRTYRIGTDGVDHTLHFSPQLNWLTDGESYTNQTPSLYCIDALEESELLLWSRDRFNALFQHIPALKEFSEQLIARNLYLSRNRLYKTISATPAEKYEDFINTYPGILLRIPLRMVASYLGVSLKTLTRIRHAQLPQEMK
ncbi:Crp/Fnr family transcriptional regulator [Arsenicibacter rosenii]|nr:Crp/Fnr family transcriptional regulator [Arsenicibacter rosenii]